MGVFRRLAVMAASILAATAIAGVAGGGTASAAVAALVPPPAQLCLTDPQDNFLCAYGQGSNPIAMSAQVATTTNWYFPTGGGGQISQENTTNCMQVDASIGYKVIEATCNGQSYQQWNVVDDPGATGYYQFQSQYNLSDCLTFNADASQLEIGGCGSTDWYQHFYPSTMLIITP
jgi:hypothetical protein